MEHSQQYLLHTSGVRGGRNKLTTTLHFLVHRRLEWGGVGVSERAFSSPPSRLIPEIAPTAHLLGVPVHSLALTLVGWLDHPFRFHPILPLVQCQVDCNRCIDAIDLFIHGKYISTS
ncbi:hypothetical protein EYZ11_004833 [Aspergillus tanneri]|uniref:Uncharacterized protein n=1 Tax=Aspergillus tanneri TaxID=1220188 RepID=A0A4S3JQE7_9EURO|nr:hypothetical protein EYZ11_004833 [Aspergillus tanneri]